jgi:FlaA1/EpsC-like NDP-sugar epimerase
LVAIKVSVADLQQVSIVDLLGRDVVKPNQDLLGKNIASKVVMVTGAGGTELPATPHSP